MRVPYNDGPSVACARIDWMESEQCPDICWQWQWQMLKRWKHLRHRQPQFVATNSWFMAAHLRAFGLKCDTIICWRLKFPFCVRLVGCVKSEDFVLEILCTTSLCLCLVVVIIKILWIQSGWLSVCLRLCVCALLFIIALHAIPSIWWPVTIQLWFDYENWCQNIIYPNGNWERGREGEQNFSVFVENKSTEKSTQW